MAAKFVKPEAAPDHGLICPHCHKDLANGNDPDIGAKGVWDQRFAPRGIFHCENPAGAFAKITTVHHSNTPLHPPCWRCKKPLGCTRCLGRDLHSIWCWNCKVWATLEGLLGGGVHKGIILDRHPAQWIAASRGGHEERHRAQRAEVNALLSAITKGFSMAEAGQ